MRDQRVPHNKPPKQIKFESSWLVESNFTQFVHQTWNSRADPMIMQKLNSCAKELTHWSEANCNRTRKDIDKYKHELELSRIQVDETNVHNLVLVVANFFVWFLSYQV
jgi:hypothetical protein